MKQRNVGVGGGSRNPSKETTLKAKEVGEFSALGYLGEQGTCRAVRKAVPAVELCVNAAKKKKKMGN